MDFFEIEFQALFQLGDGALDGDVIFLFQLDDIPIGKKLECDLFFTGG